MTTDLEFISVRRDLNTHAADIDAHMSDFGQSRRLNAHYATGKALSDTLALVADNLYALPVFIARPITISRLSFRVSIAAAAGKKARIGIYRNTVSTMYPGALVKDYGEAAVDAVAIKAINFDQAITAPGIYWLVIISDSTPTVNRASYDNALSIWLLGLSDNFHINGTGGWRAALAYPANLPDPFTVGGATTSDAGSIIVYRLKSED